MKVVDKVLYMFVDRELDVNGKSRLQSKVSSEANKDKEPCPSTQTGQSMSGASSSGLHVKELTESHEEEIAKAGTKTWAEVKEQMLKLEEENQKLKDKVRAMDMKVIQVEKMAKADTESDTSELTGIDT